MKKNIFLFGVTFALLFSAFLISPTTAQAGEKVIETYDKGGMDIWAVAPTFYRGDKDIIVYSSSHPEGEHVGLKEVYFDDNGWSLFLATHENNLDTSVGSYWAVASTSGDDFSSETMAQCYIDTDTKSIYPDLEDGYTSYSLIKEPEKKILGYVDGGIVFEGAPDSNDIDGGIIFEGTPDSNYVDDSGMPQLFCLFGEIETFPRNADEAELFFVSMMQKYIEKQHKMAYSDLSLYTFFSWISNSASQATGHFDDYFYFYKPIGIPLYQYLLETNNTYLWSLIISEKSSFGIDRTVKDFVAYAEGLPNSLSKDVSFEQLETWEIKGSDAYKMRDWGWEFYVDTRDLERDANGYVCEDIGVTAESNGRLLFPALGDKIPKDLPGYLSVFDTYPTKTQKPDDKDSYEEKDQTGESRFEVFPDETKEESKEESLPTEPSEEEETPSTVPYVVGLLLLAVAAIIAIIFGVVKRKKR